jgi:antitoxin CptB
MSEQDRAQRLSRLRYRSWRRGTREMDLLLGPFADRHLSAMNETELAAYERLLDESDTFLMSWLTGQAEPPAEMDPEQRGLLRRAAENIQQGSAVAAGQRKTN